MSGLTRRGLLTAGAGAIAGISLGRSTPVRAATGSTITADVVIIGAGLSGLTAALRLMQDGKSVVVLEANDRVGGRTHRLNIGNGQTTEGGGQWIGPGQDRIFALIDELGLKTFKTYIDGQSIYYRDGVRKFYPGPAPVPGLVNSVPPISEAALADFLKAEATLTAMAQTVPVGRPWEAPLAAQWDHQSFGDWIDQNMLTDEGRWIVGLAYSIMSCQNPHSDSLLWLLNVINTCEGFESPISVQGAAQDSRVEGGTWMISAKLAERVPSGRLILDSPVSEIQGWDEEEVTVVSSKATVKCCQVIVAMSPTEVTRIGFTPDLPAQRAGLQRDGGSGEMSKLFMVYDKPFWRDGLNGGPTLNAQVVSDLEMVPYVSDNSPSDGSAGVLVTFMLPSTTAPNPYLVWSDEVLNDKTVRARRLGEDLAEVFGDERFKQGQFYEKLWTNEKWIHGCVNLTAPGVLTRYRDAATASIGNLHWAGSDTSLDNHPSYMDGAVRSGERAAREAAAACDSTRHATPAPPAPPPTTGPGTDQTDEASRRDRHRHHGDSDSDDSDDDAAPAAIPLVIEGGR